MGNRMRMIAICIPPNGTILIAVLYRGYLKRVLKCGRGPRFQVQTLMTGSLVGLLVLDVINVAACKTVVAKEPYVKKTEFQSKIPYKPTVLPPLDIKSYKLNKRVENNVTKDSNISYIQSSACNTLHNHQATISMTKLPFLNNHETIRTFKTPL